MDDFVKQDIWPERTTGQRVPESLLEAIKVAIESGLTRKEIKKKFHVSHRTIMKAVSK